MQTSLNLDLYLFGVAAAASLLLGFTVFFQDIKSATNRLFLTFTIFSSGWGLFNYLSYQELDPILTLWVVRLVMFFAVYQAFSFFLLMLAFPEREMNFRIRKIVLLFVVVFLTSILTLTPFVFSGVRFQQGGLPQPIPAPGIVVFALVAISSVVGGIITLVKRIVRSTKQEKKPLSFLAVGVVIMFMLIIFFNFIFVAVLNDSSFVPMSSIFIFPFVAFTSYAIIRHELLNIRIVTTEILTFVLIIIAFVEVILSRSFMEIILRFGVFISLLFVGILFIKSVIKEVQQREKLQELTEKLKALDAQKNEFISMAAHELRAPMTAIKGYVSMVMEGDTGDIPEKARGFLADASNITDRLVRLVNNMLNVSRIEEGRMVYQVEVENLSQVARAVFSQFVPEAQRKGLKYDLHIPNELRDRVKVDPDRIQEVLGNFLSNAIKYTDSGSVSLHLSQPSTSIVRCEVIDTGPGISKEEQDKLFQKFYRVESNVGKTTGTGLGLYISRLLIEKFDGKIGIKSELGKGSNFWFELPLVS